MPVLTPASKTILRHSRFFIKSRVLFAGALQDTLPTFFSAMKVRVHTNQYYYWKLLNLEMGQNIQFSLAPDANFIADCDTLIYYWQKSKEESKFQLYHILALLPIGSDLFIVGENRGGVRSTEKVISGYSMIEKIDRAHRCSLYYGKLNARTTFNLSDWWKSYSLDGLIVKTLPGVFSRDKPDTGSTLLLSTLEDPIDGKVLDVGCGAGIIAAMIARRSPKIQVTLSDVSAAALYSSLETLKANKITGEVLTSNVYSNIHGYFDMIISNPSFHNSLRTNLSMSKALINGSLNHLSVGGRLRIVANAFLPYQNTLDATFGSHEILAENSRFKVYQAVVKPELKN